MGKNKNKQPRAGVVVRSSKKPGVVAGLLEPKSWTWSFRKFDPHPKFLAEVEARQAPKQIDEDNDFIDNARKELLIKLKGFEHLSRQDLRQQKSHRVEIVNLIRPARDRLAEMKLDDYEQLFSFRLNNKTRIYCLEEIDSDNNSYMLVIWLDLHHVVYESKKKGT